MAFHSAKYNPAKRNYGAGDKELLDIIQACAKWHFYLEGLPSKIYTDHEPTKRYIISLFFHFVRLTGWSRRISCPCLVYHSGSLNVVAYMLSHRPQHNQLYLVSKDESTCAAWLKKVVP